MFTPISLTRFTVFHVFVVVNFFAVWFDYLPPRAMHFINAVSPWLKGPANLRKGIPFTLVITNLLGGTEREESKIRKCEWGEERKDATWNQLKLMILNFFFCSRIWLFPFFLSFFSSLLSFFQLPFNLFVHQLSSSCFTFDFKCVILNWIEWMRQKISSLVDWSTWSNDGWSTMKVTELNFQPFFFCFHFNSIYMMMCYFANFNQISLDFFWFKVRPNFTLLFCLVCLGWIA